MAAVLFDLLYAWMKAAEISFSQMG